MRIAMGVEYDGGSFCGWQWQVEIPTVQEAVEHALSKVADQAIRVVCAGRTDTGVHASAQVIHFDTSAQRSERAWVMGANANLPRMVSMQWAKVVDSEFHARFSARRRRYRYVLFCRPVRPTFLAQRVTWEYRELDAGRMDKAASCFLGEHDFSAYRAQQCQARSPIRSIYAATVVRNGPFITFEVEANGFLHHMVRNMMGVLIAIGAGEQPVEWASVVLEQRDRARGGVTAPPDGLYLTAVEYDSRFAIPSPPWPGIIA